jgi:tetratricopeptide (TPR) repeat protein
MSRLGTLTRRLRTRTGRAPAPAAREGAREGTGSTSPASSASPDVDRQLAHARAVSRGGDAAAAVDLLRELAVRAPGRADVHHALGRSLEQLGDLEAAATAYETAIDRDAADPVRHHRLGTVRQRTGDLPAAASAYQAAVDRDPTRARWHAQLGAVRRKQRDFAGAAQAYREATHRGPDREMWHFWLGACLELSGDWAGATLAYTRADRVAAAAEPPRPAPSRQLAYLRRVRLSLVPRPQYGYGIHRACELATKLGIPRITAVELGVAGGNGLVAMEANAAEIAELTGVAVDVVGFDTGGGLYEPVDVRDMPYFFAAGAYAMDLAALQPRLRDARLILGDATTTFGEFLASGPAPIGFLSFDMDVYSATKGVLDHLGGGADHARFLPRTTVYFDDVAGWQGQDYNRFTGELLAIDEFNDEQPEVKLAEDRTFRTMPVNHTWHHGTYTMHRFQHPAYATYVSPADASSLSLAPDA